MIKFLIHERYQFIFHNSDKCNIKIAKKLSEIKDENAAAKKDILLEIYKRNLLFLIKIKYNINKSKHFYSFKTIPAVKYKILQTKRNYSDENSVI